jgi:hypothetical protein
MSSVDFEQEVARQEEECVYMLLVSWRIRSAINPREFVYTPLAFARFHICWEGLDVRRSRGLLRVKAEEHPVFRTLDVSDLERAECAKGPGWPERQSYELLLDTRSGTQVFYIDNALALDLLKEAVGALRKLGIEVEDRHDVFWRA